MRRYVITAIKISFVVYLSILFIILFVRHRGVWWSDMTIWEYAMMHMNLIPFKTIGGYVDAIVEIAAFYSIPVLDLYRVSGIQSRVPEWKERYMPDGLHPNDAGHVRIADKLMGFLSVL